MTDIDIVCIRRLIDVKENEQIPEGWLLFVGGGQTLMGNPTTREILKWDYDQRKWIKDDPTP